jgi:acyl-CoA synthetase (AMP-forming)/AMP-acid ligase II
MKSFFIDIYKFLILLDVICLNDSYSIAIHARRSKQWIALYLACFIKGVDFVILSPFLKKEELFTTLNFISTSYLFTEQHLNGFNRTDMYKIPFLKGSYDIDTITPIALKRSVYNTNIPYLSLDTINGDFIDENIVLALQERYQILGQESYVMNMTSGVSHFETKITLSSARSIEATVQAGRNIMPYNELNKVYSEVEFAHSHIVTVLIPFIKGCCFVSDADNANVIIESTETFEQKWREEVEHIFEIKFLYWFFKQHIFQGLFNIIAGRMIKSFYDNMEHIIVYNGSIQERALRIAGKYLPLYVTYGSQETNQLMACNFSGFAYSKLGSVGRTIGKLTLNKHNELKFESEGVFTLYLGDNAHTKYIKDNFNKVRTGDQGEQINGFIALKGRMSSVYEYDGNSINLDEVERHLRSLPYIEECILVPWEDKGVNLLVTVNQRLIEAHKMGVLETTALLDKFYKTLSNVMKNHIVVADVAISHEPYVKSFDGKIKTKLYRPD